MSTSDPSPARTWPRLHLRLHVPPRRRLTLICLAAALLALGGLGLSAVRNPLLRAAGRMLVTTDPLEPADVIVISVDVDGAGVLEAADLVKAGIAQRVAIFADPPDEVDREFVRRGLHYYNAAEVSMQQLHQLGVAQVEVIPRPVAGTEDESVQLPLWGAKRGVHKILFIASTDHTRRTRRELARSTRGSGLKVIVRGSPYSDFDPDHWWQSREGIRTEVVETQKLLVDMLRHPFG